MKVPPKQRKGSNLDDQKMEAIIVNMEVKPAELHLEDKSKLVKLSKSLLPK